MQGEMDGPDMVRGRDTRTGVPEATEVPGCGGNDLGLRLE